MCFDQDGMSLNLFDFIYYSSIIMKEFIVRNADGLTKFTKGEHVLTDGKADVNWEVKVYKLDCDWEILLNDRGNKVSYSIAFNRLRDTNVKNLMLEAGTIEQRVMNKTFTDKTLDKAADYVATINKFTKLTVKLRDKLAKVANNLMWKVNELTISADAYDADKFNKAMKEIDKLAAYLEKKPMTDIADLYTKIVGDDKEEDYDPSTVLD